jgi:hypothetical protein
MSHKSIYVAAGTFAVGAILGLSRPDSPDASNTIARQQLSETTSTLADGLSERSVQEDSNRGASADFAERLKKVIASFNGLKRSRAVAAIADGLDSAQVQRAIEEIRRIHIPEQGEILASLYSRWAELEPEIAFAAALNSRTHREGLGTVVKSWAIKDPAAARDAVEKLSGHHTRKVAASGLIEGLSESDPRQAFEVARRIQTYSSTVETLFENWMDKDPEEAVLFATKFPTGWDRQAAIRSVAQKLADMDPQRALQWAEALSDSDAFGSTGMDSPLARIASKWMADDPESAFRWLKGRPVDSRTAGLVFFSYGAAFNVDPELSAKIISMLPNGQIQEAARVGLMSIWSNSDLDGALMWVERQDEETQRDMFPVLLGQLAMRDPERALSLAAKLGDKREAAEYNVAINWAKWDPAAAARWIGPQPTNAHQLTEIVSAWLQRDHFAASKWMNAVAEGTVKDEVLGNVAKQLEHSYPQIALSWIAGIGAEEARQKAYDSLADAWLTDDPMEARKVIAAAPLSDELRAKLLQRSSK